MLDPDSLSMMAIWPAPRTDRIALGRSTDQDGVRQTINIIRITAAPGWSVEVANERHLDRLE